MPIAAKSQARHLHPIPAASIDVEKLEPVGPHATDVQKEGLAFLTRQAVKGAVFASLAKADEPALLQLRATDAPSRRWFVAGEPRPQVVPLRRYATQSQVAHESTGKTSNGSRQGNRRMRGRSAKSNGTTLLPCSLARRELIG